jgi:hypothetical protein
MYRPKDTTTTFPEALAGVILRHKATTYKETLTNERKLHKQQKQNQQLEYENLGPYPTHYTIHYATASRLRESYTATP